MLPEIQEWSHKSRSRINNLYLLTHLIVSTVLNFVLFRADALRNANTVFICVCLLYCDALLKYIQ